MKNNFIKVTEAFNDEMIAFCQDIIRIPSYSGAEKDVAELVSNKLEQLGYDEVFTDAWGNVVGIIHGGQPGPSIMYNGHMDAVTEGNLEAWGGYDPFGGEIDECLVYDCKYEQEEMVKAIHGRGASDMKCGLVTQIYTGAALVKLREMGYTWKGDFILAAVVLEENGEMMGTIKLCEETFRERNINVDGMVCAEPTSLRLMLGHRGRMEIRVTVFGKSCHGSSPWLGINAVEKASKLISRVPAMIAEKALEDEKLGKSGMTLTMLDIEPNALCVVPNKCNIVYDRRLVPGETPEDAIAQIQQIIDELKVEDPEFEATVEINKNLRTAFTGKAEVIESSKEAYRIEENHPFVVACAKGLEAAGVDVVYDHWAFSTDCPQLAVRMNKPVVGFSGGQEFYVHNETEKARIDYLEKTLLGNVGMYIELTELPIETFKMI